MDIQQLRALRRQTGCVFSPAVPAAKLKTGRRIVDPCDVPVTPPAPVFIPPSAFPVRPELVIEVVPSLAITNSAQTAACASPSVGTSVTIDAGTLTDSVDLSNIPSLSSEQGANLFSISSSTLTALVVTIMSSEESAALAAIAAVLYIDGTQSTWVYTQVITSHSSLNAQALTLASDSLVCLYGNVGQTATCPDDTSIAGLSPIPPLTSGTIGTQTIRSTYTVAANTYMADTADDANAQAMAYAQAQLVCAYGNLTQTSYCPPGNNTNGIPNDTSSLNPSMGPRLGTFTVDANTFVATHVVDANAQAVNYAEQQLNCYYLNASVTQTCSDLGKTGTAAAGTGNPVTGARGSTVAVPAHYIVSALSQADADEQATILAQSLLDCFWANTTQNAACDSQEYNGVYYAAQSGDSYVATVAAGSVTSYVSLDDANTQALALAESMKQCVYCNVDIPAVCANSTNTGSLQATLDIPAGSYCASSIAEAQQWAISVGSVPIAVRADSESACTFGNTLRIGACASSISTAVNAAPFTDAGDVDSRSTPNPGATSPDSPFVQIGANTFIVTIAEAVSAGYTSHGHTHEDAVDYANALADNMLLASMNCFASNDAIANVICAQDTGSSGTQDMDTSLHSYTDTTKSPPVTTYFYVDPFKSYLSYLQGLGLTFVSKGTVGARIFISYESKANANAQAAQMVKAMTVCSATIGSAANGQPGNDGPAGECNAGCYGFYS